MNKKLTIENTRGLVDPCIYMLTAPNGKIYVGSTINGFHLRAWVYRNESAHGVINHALKKYEARNFTFSILERSKDWQKIKLQEREQHYLDTLQPFGNHGYNIERVAGKVTPRNARCVSQYTRAGVLVKEYESAYQASRETGIHQASFSACCKGRKLSMGGYLWLYSKDANEQEIARRVEQAASVVSTSKRCVSQYTRAGVLVKEYESASQASRETGAHASEITRCCKGQAQSAGGYLWLYFKDTNEQEIARRVEQAADKQQEKPVSQYTHAGALVASYASASQSMKETGVSGSNIAACCKGKVKSAGGFIWKYTKEKPHAIGSRGA